MGSEPYEVVQDGTTGWRRVGPRMDEDHSQTVLRRRKEFSSVLEDEPRQKEVQR